jgi:hypothetical protein
MPRNWKLQLFDIREFLIEGQCAMEIMILFNSLIMYGVDGIPMSGRVQR